MASCAEGTLVLVTGASGYIATHVVQQLEQGYRVRGTVRSLQNATKMEPLRQLCPTAKYPIELVEADLLKENSWPSAVKDCQYVMHVASPFPDENPKDEDDVLKPAVDGTLNVLRACQEVRSVKRVVVTSSTVAICGEGASRKYIAVYTEADWADPDSVSMTYVKSKALSERAAWDFHAQLPDEDRFEMAVVNPGYVIGPILCGTSVTSMELSRRLLERQIPMLPRIHTTCVDVRDVAAAHVAAMVIPEAAGHRHIVSAKSLWLSDIAIILKKEFKLQGYSVPTSTIPFALLWVLSWFDETVNMMLPAVGREVHVDNSRMRDVLNVIPRDADIGLLDMAYSMIDRGFVKKTSKYTGPK